jgi:hypothetical protein
MISGRQSPGFKKASALLARVIKPRNDIEIPDLSSEDLRITGDDPVWAGRILSGDLKKKLLNVNKKFLFLRLYAEDKAIICNIRGLPETGEDLEELLDAVLSLYDQASRINNTFGNSPGVEGGIYETYKVGKNLIGGIPVELVLVGSFYLICGLISAIFFGRLCFESFIRHASGAPFLLLFTLLSIGGSLGGIGVLFLKRWGMMATYDFNLLVALLFIISKWKDAGLIKSLPLTVSFADSNIFFLLVAPIFFSFWVFNKPETKKLFNRTGSKTIL